MPTRNARKEQIERALAGELTFAYQGLSWRYYATRTGPAFCWTTERASLRGETGWVSFVCENVRHVYEPVTASFVMHRTRKAAKARAWNLYQGWRLARSLKVTWRSFA